jgi:hypothetical protein
MRVGQPSVRPADQSGWDGIGIAPIAFGRDATRCQSECPGGDDQGTIGTLERRAEGLDGATIRLSVIVASAELQERELIKLSSLAAALRDALRRRGTSGPTATLTAEAGIAVFGVAFERWVTETAAQQLSELIHESLEELRAVTASGPFGGRASALNRSPRCGTDNDHRPVSDQSASPSHDQRGMCSPSGTSSAEAW